MVTMAGWLSAEAARASVSKRRRLRLVSDQPLGNHLERHGATEPCVDAAVDLTHASRSEEVLDFVGPESIAGDERHRAAP